MRRLQLNIDKSFSWASPHIHNEQRQIMHHNNNYHHHLYHYCPHLSSHFQIKHCKSSRWCFASETYQSTFFFSEQLAVTIDHLKNKINQSKKNKHINAQKSISCTFFLHHSNTEAQQARGRGLPVNRIARFFTKFHFIKKVLSFTSENTKYVRTPPVMIWSVKCIENVLLIFMVITKRTFRYLLTP